MKFKSLKLKIYVFSETIFMCNQKCFQTAFQKYLNFIVNEVSK